MMPGTNSEAPRFRALREDRLVRIPIIKSVAGADLATVSDGEKNIYREIEENMKKEENSRRDDW